MPYVAGPGSMEYLIRKLEELNGTVSTAAVACGLKKLRVYPLRRMSMELPAIYAWVAPSPMEWMDVSGHRHRTHLNLSLRVSIGRTDSDELSHRLIRYGDVMREIALPAFRNGQPLGNAAKWLDAPGLSIVNEDFGEQTFPAIELSIRGELDIHLNPTQ